MSIGADGSARRRPELRSAMRGEGLRCRGHYSAPMDVSGSGRFTLVSGKCSGLCWKNFEEAPESWNAPVEGRRMLKFGGGLAVGSSNLLLRAINESCREARLFQNGSDLTLIKGRKSAHRLDMHERTRSAPSSACWDGADTLASAVNACSWTRTRHPGGESQQGITG